MKPPYHIRATKIRREAEGYLELGMPRHALQALGRLGDPTRLDSDSLYLWGESLRAMQRHCEAIMPLERAAKIAPRDIRIQIALGWCYKRTGRLDLAIGALERALRIAPGESLLCYNLACYLSLAGHKRQALRYLSQALAMDPSYREMVEEESDFDSLRLDADFQAVCAGLKK